VGRDVHTYSLAEMMAALRLSRYDPAVLNDCYTMMFRLLPSAAEQDRMSLRTVLRRVREHYFFVGEHPDAAFVVGSLLCAMGDYVEALDCRRQSERLNGPLAATLFQQARCCYHLGDKKMALDTLRACRSMPGDFEQFLVLAGILDAPRASEFEQQLAWELALGEAAPSRDTPLSSL
jgi:tetratricopeptide (TPR) repeat protein